MKVTPLLIPVENQVRELDGKLLLACIAAERGCPVILGSRTHIHFEIASLPRGLYLAKSIRSKSEPMFSIMHKLGVQIVAWDEEALMHGPEDEYFQRRASPKALSMTSALFAWGEDNAELFRGCPGYQGAPVYPTGNPRFDMMRPELRGYFDEAVEGIKGRFGDFILVNTNFGILNHFSPSLGVMDPVRGSGQHPGRGARGNEFRTGLALHRYAIFQHFCEMLPRLAEAFPDRNVILRPHPVENIETWKAVAVGQPNLQVIHEGNVIPWLLACDAVVHNSCTTGVEAFILGVPCVAYQPLVSDRFDNALPNALSYRAFDFEDLRETLGSILERQIGPCREAEQSKLLERHVSGLEGPLAGERIIDVLARSGAVAEALPPPGAIRYSAGWATAKLRVIEKKLKGMIPGHRNSPAFFRHRFSRIDLAELRSRIARFQRLLSRFYGLEVTQISDHIFWIELGAGPTSDSPVGDMILGKKSSSPKKS
jgi:surface carbohydrate biosynthesis protein